MCIRDRFTISPQVLFIPYLQTSSKEPPCAPIPGTSRKCSGAILRISSNARPCVAPVSYKHLNGSGSTRVIGELYPFGFGLSYTSFAYSNLKVSPLQQRTQGEYTVKVDITNTGKRAGDEIVQLYIRDKVSSVIAYDSELRGFERISLQPGETKQVTFTLKPEDLQLLDRNMHWTVEPGDFEILVGASSQDIRLKETITALP